MRRLHFPVWVFLFPHQQSKDIHASVMEEWKSRCGHVSDWCMSGDGPLICPGGNPASLCDASFWYSFIYGEKRDGPTIPTKHLIIILPYDNLWERTPGPSADPDRFRPFVHVTLPGLVLHPGPWNPSALMSSCSIRYIRAKLFIVGFGAAIVLFCSLRGAKSQFTSEHRANPELCVLMSGICCLIEVRLIN